MNMYQTETWKQLKEMCFNDQLRSVQLLDAHQTSNIISFYLNEYILIHHTLLYDIYGNYLNQSFSWFYILYYKKKKKNVML